MNRWKRFTAASLALAALLAASAAQAQQYPAKPVRLVVPFPAGGPADLVARLLSAKLTEHWGQPLVVENRGGAGGNIGTAAVAKSPADGYTLLLTTSVFMCNPSLYKSTGYDPFKDFAPVTLVGISATIIVRHPSLAGVNTMHDIAQLAKASPVNYASPGIGTAGHLAAELFKTLAKVDMQAVPFAGAGPAINALLGGQVKLGFMAVPSTVPHIKAGRMVAIAVTSPKRLEVLPDVPTVAESGYPGFQVDNMYGLLAPKGTPPEVIGKLNADVVQMLRQPDVRKPLETATIEIVADTPDDFARYIESEYVKWAKVVKESGAQVN
jgi:tripartite-type tricarboxylate transporter receptor subunit TctC